MLSVKFSYCIRVVSLLLLLDDVKHILTILILDHRLSKFTELHFRNPATSGSDDLKANYLEALTFLNHLNESRGLGEDVVCTCIQLGKTTTKCLHL